MLLGVGSAPHLESLSRGKALFDRSIAAKLPEGAMDAQDFVAWSEMKLECMSNQGQRVNASGISGAI